MNGSSKKLINSPQACVEDCLKGFVAANPGLSLLPGHNVIIRRDIEKVKAADKVTLLCGGGSGHEPAHAGYVGPGMLSGAIAGAVFTSPPPGSILAAIRAVGRGNKAGTILIVKNYTGDRLNFGLASERAKAENLQVDMVVVGEDCALSSADKTAGRRGLAGTILVNKIAGAMAEEGRPLLEIVHVLKHVTGEMGTIGLSLSPCSLPGSQPSFSIGPDEMELGLGIHGEAGVRRMKMLSAKDTVKTMLDHMTNSQSSTHVKLKKGDKVALVVNDLGGTSGLELGIVTKEAIEWLGCQDVSVDRVYCGTLMTSLEMAGVSLTVLHLNEQRRAWLDSPTEAPAWIKPLLFQGQGVDQLEQKMDISEQATGKSNASGKKVEKETETRLRKAVAYACEALGNCELQLNKLDSQSGDGDCGTTFKRGTDAILKQVSEDSSTNLPVSEPQALALVLAAIVEKEMGGSSGALYSIMLTAASKPLSGDVSPTGWCAALAAGIAAIRKYGGAEPGDRTMLDALVPAHQALEVGLQSGPPLAAFGECVKAAEEGAMRTVGLVAQAGRASYVSPDLLTQPDPGAHAVGIWMRAAYEALKLPYTT